ncbi:MAG: hypothetical protein R2784_10205 [Saprospiraceae bacterium]
MLLFNLKIRKKFTCGFVVQPAYVEDAIKEIERCVTQNYVYFACLLILNKEGDWTAIADESTIPIFEKQMN